MDNQIQTQNGGGSLVSPGSATQIAETRQLSPAEVISRIDDVKTIMANAMLPGVHYGKIEGCGEKPCLSKAGAEMLAMTFRLCPELACEVKDLGGGHREYMATCSLRNIATGIVWAQGLGSCSTLEKKYRYRNEWHNNVKTRVENKDLADVYNTCLKMAKKRAQVDATLTALSCSHLFTQDLDDYKEDFGEEQNAPKPKAKTVPDVKKAAPQNAKDAELVPPAPPPPDEPPPPPDEPPPDFTVNINRGGSAAPKPAAPLAQSETQSLVAWLQEIPDRKKALQITGKYCNPANVGTLSKAQAKKLVDELVNVFGITYAPSIFEEA